MFFPLLTLAVPLATQRISANLSLREGWKDFGGCAAGKVDHIADGLIVGQWTIGGFICPSLSQHFVMLKPEQQVRGPPMSFGCHDECDEDGCFVKPDGLTLGKWDLVLHCESDPQVVQSPHVSSHR